MATPPVLIDHGNRIHGGCHALPNLRQNGYQPKYWAINAVPVGTVARLVMVFKWRIIRFPLNYRGGCLKAVRKKTYITTGQKRVRSFEFHLRAMQRVWLACVEACSRLLSIVLSVFIKPLLFVEPPWQKSCHLAILCTVPTTMICGAY